MPYADRVFHTIPYIEPHKYLLKNFPRQTWDTTDVDYLRNKRLHLTSHICDMELEYCEKAGTISDEDYKLLYWMT